MGIIDKVAWVHIEARRVLCVRSQGRSLAYLPGGKREPGESDAECLGREIEEELGVLVDPCTLVPSGVFVAPADGNPEGATVRLACYRASYSGELRASAEIAELMWVNRTDKSRCSVAACAVLDALHDLGLVD